MLFPKKIANYAIGITAGKRETTQASIHCLCGSESFELLYYGKISKKLFSRDSIICDDDEILILEAVCTSCKKNIVLFDSRTDGYSAQIEENSHKFVQKFPIKKYTCKKCQCTEFKVNMRIEYSDMDEIDYDLCRADCYSWIWIDVECKQCKSRINGIVDMETA